MTVENISWSISMKECCRPRRGLNSRPLGLQSDGATNWTTEAGIIHFEVHWYTDGVFNLFIQGLRLKCQCYPCNNSTLNLWKRLIPKLKVNWGQDSCFCIGNTNLKTITLVTLNKSMPRQFLIVSQSDYSVQVVDTNPHTEWQCRSTLFAKAEPVLIFFSTLVLLNPNIPCLSKQCWSKSVGFQLI